MHSFTGRDGEVMRVAALLALSFGTSEIYHDELAAMDCMNA